MKAAVSLALVGLMAQADDQVASATAPPTSGAQIFEDVVDECKGRFKGTLGLLYPNDDPGRALDDLSIGICLDYASFLPRKYPIFEHSESHEDNVLRHPLNQGPHSLKLLECGQQSCQH